MTTYAELRTKVSRDLRDTDGLTFDTNVVKDMVAASLAEIGRLAPDRFQEDITPVADTLSYVVRSSVFGGALVPEMELVRVEIWDTSQTRDFAVLMVQPASAEVTRYSQAGWYLWGGRLYLPDRIVDFIDPTKHLIRVWGYSPYPELVNDADVVPLSTELEEALRDYVRLEGLNRLIGSRTLFTQWQTRTNNTDVTVASLMNEANIVGEQWRRRARAIFVPREAP